MRSAGGRGGAPLERARIGVVKRLRARRSEIDEAIFARVSDRWFDRTGSEDPEYVAGLRAAGVAALDYILVGIERSGQSLESVPAAVLEQARRAARVGVGVDTVLRRYHAGYAVLERFVIQEAEREEENWIPPTPRVESRGLDPAPPRVLGEVIQITSALVERLSAAVSSAYNKEIEQAAEDSLTPSPPNTGSPLRGTQRERILQAVVEVVAEHGVAGASVGLVVKRAKVSRRTFYELFPAGLEDGLVAVLDWGLERASAQVVAGFAGQRSWQDGMRRTLGGMLALCDTEYALVRVCMLETLTASPAVRAHREWIMGEYRALVLERVGNEVSYASPLAAEGVMASVMSLAASRMIEPEHPPLVELLGQLMGIIVEPFMDPAGVAWEIEKGNELAGRILEQRRSQPPGAIEGPPGVDVTLIPPALRDPRAHRARLCLMYVAQQIGVSHRGQLAKLLGRLAEEGLLVKRTGAPGHPNAWSATPTGEKVAQALADYR